MAEMDLISVSRLNTYVNRVVHSLEPLKNLHVVGELSNFKRYSSGHCYFSLKDQEAQVSCVMFNSFAGRLAFEPKDGQSVILTCAADYYVKSGKFQLQAFSMELEGQGQLYRKFEELKERLEAEGLFAPERKKALPFLPRSIGVVTSPSGAVIRDIIHVLRRRNPHFRLVLVPAAVQGDQAAASLVRGVELLNQAADVDVIIIGRGGGSIEDLWPFNEEAVARAVASSAIPVISAVGHETDFTICDFVADRRAPTPSAAAEICMPLYSELVNRVSSLEDSIGHRVGRHLSLAGERLSRLEQSRQLEDPLNIVRLRRDIVTRLSESRVLTNPQLLVETREQYLDLLESRLARSTTAIRSRMESRLSSAAAKLDALSPLKVLGRGYSLVIDREGRAVQSVQDVSRGDELDLRLQDGSISVLVNGVEPGTADEAGSSPAAETV